MTGMVRGMCATDARQTAFAGMRAKGYGRQLVASEIVPGDQDVVEPPLEDPKTVASVPEELEIAAPVPAPEPEPVEEPAPAALEPTPGTRREPGLDSSVSMKTRQAGEWAVRPPLLMRDGAWVTRAGGAPCPVIAPVLELPCTPSSRRPELSPNVTRLVIEAPRIAEIRKPGQFVIVHRGPGSERIPLTIADADAERGTITLVIQAVGKSTEDLVSLEVGEAITDVAGPLGRETELVATATPSASRAASGRPSFSRSRSRRCSAREGHGMLGARSKEWRHLRGSRAAAPANSSPAPTTDQGRHGLVTEALGDVARHATASTWCTPWSRADDAGRSPS